MGAVSGIALALDRVGFGGHVLAVDPQRHARRIGRRLHPDGAGQGTEGKPHHSAACPSKLPHACRKPVRHRSGHADGGAIVTEVVFGLPGLGREAVQAITTQDLPIIMGVTILSAVLVVAVNLIVDLCHALLDFRVRLE